MLEYGLGGHDDRAKQKVDSTADEYQPTWGASPDHTDGCPADLFDKGDGEREPRGPLEAQSEERADRHGKSRRDGHLAGRPMLDGYPADILPSQGFVWRAFHYHVRVHVFDIEDQSGDEQEQYQFEAGEAAERAGSGHHGCCEQRPLDGTLVVGPCRGRRLRGTGVPVVSLGRSTSHALRIRSDAPARTVMALTMRLAAVDSGAGVVECPTGIYGLLVLYGCGAGFGEFRGEQFRQGGRPSFGVRFPSLGLRRLRLGLGM